MYKVDARGRPKEIWIYGERRARRDKMSIRAKKKAQKFDEKAMKENRWDSAKKWLRKVKGMRTRA